MRRIGVSLYLSKSTFEEDQAYLDLARKYGFTRIFTSLLEIEGDTTEVINKYKRTIEYGNSIGMETILDISPALFEQLRISYEDLSFFKELGASGLRLDLGFTGLEEAMMTKNTHGLKIEVNMSSGTKYIENIMSYHPNSDQLCASHNFYPQQYTGISQKHFEETTALFNKYHLTTAAFVTSQVGKLGPWPVQMGLCTLEDHRFLPIQTQVTHYRLMGTIDDLIIGNAYATEAELKAMSEAFFSPHPLLPVDVTVEVSPIEKKILFDETHIYRGDRSSYLIRSTATRVKYKAEDFPVREVQPIEKGDVIIGSNAFGQYKGETQIGLTAIENFGERNVVGSISKDAIFLLDYLKPWSSFQFIDSSC